MTFHLSTGSACASFARHFSASSGLFQDSWSSIRVRTIFESLLGSRYNRVTQHGRPEFRTSMSDVTLILNAIE